MLYGDNHCKVQQLIPMDRFGLFTVLHVPNKNYRRVGKKGRLGGNANKDAAENEFSDGTEQFEAPSPLLLTAMELHIAMRRTWPAKPQSPYTGITMVDEVGRGRRSKGLDDRLEDYHEYVQRGGVLRRRICRKHL